MKKNSSGEGNILLHGAQIKPGPTCQQQVKPRSWTPSQPQLRLRQCAHDNACVNFVPGCVFWSVPGWHSASTFIFMIIPSKLWCNKLFKPVFLVKAMNQSAVGFFGGLSMYSDHLDLTCIVRPELASSFWSVINSSLCYSEVQWRMAEKSLPSSALLLHKIAAQ